MSPRVFSILALAMWACGGDPTVADDASGSRDLVGISISPENVLVSVVNGEVTPVPLAVTAHYIDGSEETLTDIDWTVGDLALARVDDSDAFVASGDKGGTTLLTALALGKTASTNATVDLSDIIFVGGASDSAPEHFTAPPLSGSLDAPDLLYPLGGAVMPRTISPPNVQWDGGVASDVYRVLIDTEHASVTAYLEHNGLDFTYNWLTDESMWRKLANTAIDKPLTFTVDRWVSSTDEVHRSTAASIELADASLAGAIYYWDLEAGRLLRIVDNVRENFLPEPPTTGDGPACIACHTISPDGNYLAAAIGQSGSAAGTIFDLKADLTGSPAATVVPPGTYSSRFSTYSPDGSMLMSASYGAFALIDAATGAVLSTTGEPLPTEGATHPSWSPDGTSIAYIANTEGFDDVEFSVGDLALLPVNGTEFSEPSILQADGSAHTWPSFTPDSEWIAYGKGPLSRGKLLGQIADGSLWITHRDGGTPMRLHKANGGATVEDSYMPHFSPFDEGGYYWLVFTSLRDYGNQYVGTRGTQRRQLWVTAIKKGDLPSVDPSRAAYWLPGQNTQSENMRAYWSVAPPID